MLKSRFVILARASQKSVTTHLRYIERDGTTREGDRGHAYGPQADLADTHAFEERGRGDRHQFRLILSLEDATQLQDLKQFTREFMHKVAIDLETQLDWVGVDHWDTDNPHTHIVLRGRAADGRDLVIAPEYMSHGMRLRASDLATQWLGPRTELEIAESLGREVTQERFTSLDRALLGFAAGHVVDLGDNFANGRNYQQLRGRLQRLEAMGLAELQGRQRWQLAPNMRETLLTLGERGDILKAVNHALRGQVREVAFESDPRVPIVGRLVGKGLVDEMSDRSFLIVDGVDGRTHYLKLPRGEHLTEYPLQSVVEANCYGGGPTRVNVLCHLSVEEQIRAVGPTWLDRQLLGVRGAVRAAVGFGIVLNTALEQRADVLVDRGLAHMREDKLVAPNLLANLRRRELEAAVRDVSVQLRKPHSPLPSDARIVATVARDLKLASGRIAVLEWEQGFALVPWKRGASMQLGQPVRRDVFYRNSISR